MCTLTTFQTVVIEIREHFILHDNSTNITGQLRDVTHSWDRVKNKGHNKVSDSTKYGYTKTVLIHINLS